MEFTSHECQLELLNDYQIGLIQKEELQEAIGEISLSNYIAARKCFYQKYGYYPIKVPVYGLDGFDILRFENLARNHFFTSR